MSRRQRRANLIAILIGCAASAAVIGAYLAGALERLELITLDLRFRYANSIEASDEIVCLDITDRDLETVMRWPWPRDVQSPLVAIPAEFGARALLVDLTWTEHETARSVVPADADVLTKAADLVAGEPPERVFPDLVLSNAIATAGNVYLAYHHLVVDLERSTAFGELVDLVRNGDARAAGELAARIDADLRRRIKSDQDYAVQRPLDRARIVAALRQDPTLDERQLADRLGISDQRFWERAFERCLEAALRWRLREWLAGDADRWKTAPDGPALAGFYTTLTRRAFRGDNPLMRAVIRVYREVLSYAATTRNQLAPLERFAPIAHPVDGIAPVHFAQARVARRCCFANFEPDLDGTVRRVALIERHGDNLLSQLGFSLGWDQLGMSAESVVANPGRLILTPADPSRDPLVIQLDQRGRTLIPWVRGREWTKQFAHKPASAVLRLYDLRQNTRHNRREANRLLQLVYESEFLPDFNDFGELLSERTKLEREIERARLEGDGDSQNWYGEQLRRLEEELARGEHELRAFIADQKARLTGQAAAEGGLPRRIVDSVLDSLGQVDRLWAANRAIARQIEEMKQRLTAIFRDKICVVGYAATSLADMVPIPTHHRAPGVIAHANLLNGMLTGQLVRWATPPVNVALAAALGILVSLISTWLRPRLASLLVIFLLVSYVALAGAAAFHRWTYWIALTPALGAMISSFFCIAVYRYVFIDSERRQLTTALGQYTSATLARKMAEDAELCRRAETREVTAMFTDLRGFTPISEQIGAERTQKVLNLCLGRCSEVMLRHEAMINKFIGDGIFAFWNPVIYPQPDHALRACETAVDLQVALRELAEEQRRKGGDEVFAELVLRIGVASGQAVVGPCGSEQKYDYTCIGDTVNVAARLESANKFYGTLILVGGATRDQLGERFVLRSLGGVQVKGKRQSVPIYELLGRVGQVPDDLCEYAQDFGQAVALFQQKQWLTASEAFAACRQRRPDDLAAERYAEAIAQFRAQPPPDDWNGAIELTEK